MSGASTSNQSFCILPWIHVQVSPDGNLYPCCRMDPPLSYGSLKEQSFAQIWNGEGIRDIRKDMLAGKRPAFCSTCWAHESASGSSLRTEALRDFSGLIPLASATLPDGAVAEGELHFLDLRLSNGCNHRCRTCNPSSSTGWHAEFGKASGTELEPLEAFQDFESLFDFLRPHINCLRRIYFAGGEPLLHPLHARLLGTLLDHGRTDIQLIYNTNLSVVDPALLATWNRFRSVSIEASIDGAEKQLEIMRKGASWAKLARNFNLLRVFCPTVEMGIYCTVSVMNAFHLPQAIGIWLENKMISRPDSLKLNILMTPRHFSLNIFNPRERNELRHRYESFRAELRGRVSPEIFEGISCCLANILDSFEGECWTTERRNFAVVTRELDLSRGEDFGSVFPELRNLLALL